MTYEAELQKQLNEEIGEDETMRFKEKDMLKQKYGIRPAFVTTEEILFWENRERRGNRGRH